MSLLQRENADTHKHELNGEIFDLERVTREHTEDVLRRHARGRGVSIKAGDSIEDLIEALMGLFNGGIYLIGGLGG